MEPTFARRYNTDPNLDKNSDFIEYVDEDDVGFMKLLLYVNCIRIAIFIVKKP